MPCLWVYPGIQGYWEDTEPFHRETQVLKLEFEEIPWVFTLNYAELKNVPICALVEKGGVCATQEDLVGMHHICQKFFDAVEKAYP